MRIHSHRTVGVIRMRTSPSCDRVFVIADMLQIHDDYWKVRVRDE